MFKYDKLFFVASVHMLILNTCVCFFFSNSRFKSALELMSCRIKINLVLSCQHVSHAWMHTCTHIQTHTQTINWGLWGFLRSETFNLFGYIWWSADDHVGDLDSISGRLSFPLGFLRWLRRIVLCCFMSYLDNTTHLISGSRFHWK